MGRRSWWRGAALGVAVVLVAAAAYKLWPRPDDVPGDEVTVGVILPLTGRSAYLGESVRRGLELAAEQHQAAGWRPQIKLVYEDSAGEVRQAVAAYHKLRSVDRAGVVVCVSTGVKAITPLADRDEVVVLCTASSPSGVTDGHPWAFRFFISADADAKLMAGYAARAGYHRVAVVYINDDMGVSYRDVFRDAFVKLGGEVVASEGYGFDVSDYRPALLNVRAAKPDAVYLIGYDTAMGRLPVQMREVGLQAPILGVGTISQPNVIKQAGPAVNGTVYSTCEFDTAAPKTPELRAFVNRYQERYNSAPVFFEVFGYDSFNLLARAMEGGKTAPSDVRAGLLGIKDFRGAAGTAHMGADRDVVFPLRLGRIVDGRLTPLPAN